MRGKILPKRLPEIMMVIGLALTATSQAIASFTWPASVGPHTHSDNCCYTQSGNGNEIGCCTIITCTLDPADFDCGGFNYHCIDIANQRPYGACQSASTFTCVDYDQFYCAQIHVYAACTPCGMYRCDKWVTIIGCDPTLVNCP